MPDGRLKHRWLTTVSIVVVGILVLLIAYKVLAG